MSNMLGLDPQAVRQLATQMQNTASQIQSMTQQLTTQLDNTQWIGPDQQRFSSDWHGTHVAQLHTVAQALNDAANSANSNAQQQEQASNS